MTTKPFPVTRGGAQGAARRELSKAIYHRNNEPLPVRAVHAFGRLIDRLLDHTAAHAPVGDLGMLAVVVIIAVLVVVVIRRVGVPQRAAGHGGVLGGEPAVTAAEHRQRAGQAAAREDWTVAVLERMRAVARELEERGIVEARPGRTATELARSAGAERPDAAASLTAAADTFNRVAYGGAAGTEALLTVVITADDAVRRPARSAALAR